MENLHQNLKARFGDEITDAHNHRGDETVVVDRGALIKLVCLLKEDTDFDMNILMDLTAVDGRDMKWNPRFEMVYHFYSMKHNHRLRVKVGVNEKDCTVPTLTGLWPIANWFEREVWDMFGIRFEGHPELKRILMYESFEGHPLRKDYPYHKRQPLIGPKN